MLTHLGQGLTAIGDLGSVAYLMVGAVLGVLIGVIPGLGGAVVLSIVLAFVDHMTITGTLCFFLGTQAGSYFSASITSILLNTPAHPEAFAVTFDGFPMAQRGEAGRALGISATSTCVGGLVGCAAFVGLLQIINTLPKLFHPPEYVALVLIAMFLVGTLGSESVAKAVVSAGLGLMVSAIGSSDITGVTRYTFNALSLYDGVSLVALALGLFSITQMVVIFGTGTTISREDMMGRKVDATAPVALERGFASQVVGGIVESLRHWVLLIQSGIIGVVTGVIPGIGGFAANFLSYGIAQQTSPKARKPLFGTGIPEGIIAPEGSSLAKEAGGLVPILGLGIPGGVGGALFLAALILKGLRVGYGFTASYPVLPYEMVWIIALSGIVGTALGILAAPFLARVTQVPGPYLVPFIIALSVVGPFVAEVSFFSVMEVAVFSIIGLVLRRLRYSLASFVLGLVLGPTFETNIYLTNNIYGGWHFIPHRIFADVLFIIAAVVLAAKAVQIRRDSRKRRASESNELAAIADPVERTAKALDHERTRHPYPLLEVGTTAVILAATIWWIWYGITRYNFATKLFPVAAGLLVAAGSAALLPADIIRVIAHARERRTLQRDFDAALAHTREPVLAGAPAGFAPAMDPYLEGGGGAIDATNGAGDGNIASPAFAVRLDSWGKQGQYTREMVGMAWVGLLIAGCWLLGFVWAVPMFCVAYALISMRPFIPSPMKRCLFAALSAAAMWGATYEMFNVLHLVFTPVVKF